MKNAILPKVLIVDGDENHQLLMEAWFEMAGYKVSQVKYGRDAVTAAVKENPDLVILDIDLPDMDWFDTMRAIKHGKRRIPIIINTGYAHHRADIHSFTADAFVIKSSNVQELVTTARELLGKRQASMNSPESSGIRVEELSH